MDAGNVEKALGVLGIKIPYRIPEDGNFSISCPFAPYDDAHTNELDKRPSCSVRVNPLDVSLFQCWTCKRRGSVVWMASALQRLGHITSRELQKIQALEVVNLEYVDIDDKPKEEPKWKKQVGEVDWGMVPKYIVETRGIPVEICREWKIGYDRKRERAVFPVWDRWGELQGMVGRSLDASARAKYPAYPGFDKPNNLYGAHLLKPGVSKSVLLVEGMLDVIQIYSYRILDKVVPLGLMGVYLLKGQREIIKDWADRAYLMLDNDKGGWENMGAIADSLCRIIPVLVPRYPKGKKDPKELSKDELLTALAEADLWGMEDL